VYTVTQVLGPMTAKNMIQHIHQRFTNLPKEKYMKKNLSLVLFVLISTNITIAQTNSKSVLSSNRIIGVDDIKNKNFRKIYQNFQTNGFLKLPVVFNREFNRTVGRRPRSYSLRNNNEPFFVNVNKNDKSRNDKETAMSYMFNETNGNYVIGIVTAISGDHNAVKNWLVTFGLSGNVIDYLPIGESFSGGRIRTIEAHIRENFTVDVQQLNFPDNDYLIEGEIPVNNLKGQRIDRSFKITAGGKFQKLNEVRFQLQAYQPSTLLNKAILISQRGEKVQK
jgi:hypothetical protein